jgi:TP901 family phage tail tape measure protein
MPGMSGEVANLIVALKLDDSGFSGKLNAAARQLKGMDAGLSQMGRGAGQVAGGLARIGTVAGVAAAGGLAAIVTTAASFEEAFTGVEKTVDGTEAQLAELETTLRAMARTGIGSFEELAGIGEAGGALGIARDSLDEFVDVVARLAISTDLTSESAATALGQLSNVLHLSESDLQDFGDSLVALGNAGASTESQIVEMAARFGAAGNSAGLSKEEILALSSAVASMGIEVEAGGSSLSRIFGNIATAIGTGGDEVEAFTDLMGISAREFQNRWSEDALGTFQDFLAELSKLDQFGQARVLEDAGITGVRDINAVRLMAQNFEFLNEQLDIAENATGALGTESDKFLKTTARQWFTLKQNVRDAAAVLGTDLLPVVNESMGAFVNWLNQADTQAGIKDFATDLAAGIRGLASELKGTDFSGILGGLRLTAEVAKGAFDAFRSLPGPIQQLAIAALVANKVTGGAVGQIAKGLGNLVLGGLKTIMAGNVTVIGKSVIGGGPTGPTRGPTKPGMNPLLSLAAILSGGALGYQIAGPEFERQTGAGQDFLTGVVDAKIVGGTLPDMERSLAALDAEMAALNGKTPDGYGFIDELLYGLDFAGLKSTLEAQRDALQAAIDAADNPNRGGTPIGQFSAKNKGGVPVVTLPDTAMQPVTTALNASLPPIRTSAMQQLAMQAQALSVTRQLGPRIDRVANTPHRVINNNNITVPVNISATVLANQIYRTSTSRSYSSSTSTNTGGI